MRELEPQNGESYTHTVEKGKEAQKEKKEALSQHSALLIRRTFSANHSRPRGNEQDHLDTPEKKTKEAFVVCARGMLTKNRMSSRTVYYGSLLLMQGAERKKDMTAATQIHCCLHGPGGKINTYDE